MCRRVDGCAEVETTVGIPVTVDVLWARRATTRLSVVAHQVRNTVADMTIVGVDHDAALILLDVVVVI